MSNYNVLEKGVAISPTRADKGHTVSDGAHSVEDGVRRMSKQGSLPDWVGTVEHQVMTDAKLEAETVATEKLERQRSVAAAVAAQEEERARQLGLVDKAERQNSLARQNTREEAMEAIDEEQKRRAGFVATIERQNTLARQNTIGEAKEAIEEERVRRLGATPEKPTAVEALKRQHSRTQVRCSRARPYFFCHRRWPSHDIAALTPRCPSRARAGQPGDGDGADEAHAGDEGRGAAAAPDAREGNLEAAGTNAGAVTVQCAAAAADARASDLEAAGQHAGAAAPGMGARGRVMERGGAASMRCMNFFCDEASGGGAAACVCL